ncbi:MAG: hypothetical protein JSS57_18360 [Proteobacteria bacterium]|nr:hypothetical protein [Pseudomonadota bacterium]
MKIAASSMEMQASHRSQATLAVDERLSAWGGRRPDGAAGQSRIARSVVVSQAARQALRQEQAQASATVARSGDDDGTKNDPKLALLKTIIEQLTGQRIRLMSVDGLSTAQQTATAVSSAAAQASAPEFGIAYDRTETRTESEETHFEASGTIQTADGKRIDFNVALSMARSETTTSSVSLRAGNAVSKDPLVINFAGEAASLENQRFSFDLMGDGQQVDMPLLGQGSGFLVLDAVGSGKVTSGRQLFGPASGDGFADLAKYDGDASGWIDEADAVFDRLGVWTPDASGGGSVRSLRDAGVGALYLGRTATPFTLKDGAALGAVRSTGVYVAEDGHVGTMQQVDVNV